MQLNHILCGCNVWVNLTTEMQQCAVSVVKHKKWLSTDKSRLAETAYHRKHRVIFIVCDWFPANFYLAEMCLLNQNDLL